MKRRTQERMAELQRQILHAGPPSAVYRLMPRNVEYGGYEERAYCVCIKKSNKPFLDRVLDFDSLLRRSLVPGERMVYENEAFAIVGDTYRISYVLEGYKKHCDRLGYMIDGRPVARLLHRMGVSLAIKRMMYSRAARDATEAKMLRPEAREAYPNPADRFVACCG